ncbi:YrhK family protein [Virgibacillus xinjiangensis]|uniref:YrhK family protein n=1 Tax=Virgibacillus xinjiangensis TaxID=393090 RepID=A0ABV7CZI1_9BACI
MPGVKNEKNYYDIQMGKFEVFFRKKYKFLSIANDIGLGIWFLVGSILFLFHSTQTAGTILFIIGSAQLLGRPILKLMHAFFVRKDTQRSQSGNH